MTPKEIRKIREVYGLTQVQMAKLLQVSGQTVSNWEMPPHRPRSSPERYCALVLRGLLRLSEQPRSRRRAQQKIDAALKLDVKESAKIADLVISAIFQEIGA